MKYVPEKLKISLVKESEGPISRYHLTRSIHVLQSRSEFRVKTGAHGLLVTMISGLSGSFYPLNRLKFQFS